MLISLLCVIDNMLIDTNSVLNMLTVKKSELRMASFIVDLKQKKAKIKLIKKKSNVLIAELSMIIKLTNAIE